MTKRKLFEEITFAPQRYYRTPNDVNRDRRFGDEERLQILGAWERDVRSGASRADAETTELRLRQLAEAKTELERRIPARTGQHVERKLDSAGS